MFSFKITHQNCKGRLGILTTPHGVIETPAFIFCATKAAMKSMTMRQVQDAKTQIILSNTYHLMLQPSSEVVERLGGLQKMTGWNGPMLTDSGGFQIFSLGHGSVADEIKARKSKGRPKTLLSIDEDGATFRSYIDGRRYHLTPETSMQIQKELGADLVVVLDECTPFHVDKDYTKQSMERSHRWARRCLDVFNEKKQALYGIVQGGIYSDLRKESVDFVQDHSFFGIAVGGSLGKTKAQMHDVVQMTMDNVTSKRPVHLLGIGGLSDIVHGASCGIDTFDCVHPTRLARHGGALVDPDKHAGKEHINLLNAAYTKDSSPIDETCLCETCGMLSKGYLHHLLKAKELSAYTLISIHNVFFMNRFMEKLRNDIRAAASH